MSCLLAGAAGATDIAVARVVPTSSGNVKDGIVDGIIAGKRADSYAEALRARLHVKLIAPLREGIISDPDGARDFLKYIRTLADRSNAADSSGRPHARQRG